MSSRPNILVFCVDQMQSFCLGCHDHPDVKTPNLDRLAGTGVDFRRGYCANSVCMPSRATMITGLTPRQHGCLTNGTCLPENVPTLPAVLARHGYRTHSVGKLHLQPFGAEPRTGAAGSWESMKGWNSGAIQGLPEGYYGFQTTDYVGGHVSYCFGDYANWLEKIQPGARALYTRDHAYHSVQPAWRLAIPEELHYNNWIAHRTLDLLKGVGEQPFFVWCSFPDPHSPFAACRPYSEEYDPAGLSLSPTWAQADDSLAHLTAFRSRQHPPFSEASLRECMAQTYGMISHIDANVGRVLDYLEETGRDRDTIIVFTADHGEYLGSHHLLHKAVWPWEELIRIPFIWRVPGSVRSGNSRRDEVASHLDLVPTLLDYAGIDPRKLDMRGEYQSDRIGLPGRSLRPFLSDGHDLEARPAVMEYDEDWHPGPTYRARTIVSDRFKLTFYPNAGGGLLCDLVDDPYETRNLWDSSAHRTVRAELTEQLLIRLALTDRLDQTRITGA